MATLAIAGGEGWPGAGMIWIGGVLPIFQMAGIALCGETEELPDGRALVAGITRDCSVGAE
jgi:hypothetical protein